MQCQRKWGPFKGNQENAMNQYVKKFVNENCILAKHVRHLNKFNYEK